MAAERVNSLRCFFEAWIFAWVVAVYLPSAILAMTGLSPLAEGRGFLSATLTIADEVSPAAKIGFALLLALLLFAARRANLSRRAATILDILLACVAMLAVIAFLPADWSRGFGIGTSGSRFAPAATLIYLASAALSGLVFNLSEARCAARRGHPTV